MTAPADIIDRLDIENADAVLTDEAIESLAMLLVDAVLSDEQVNSANS